MSMSNAQKLEMMSTLLCVILWPYDERFRSYKGGLPID